jgi:error-prone DNA polymerase
MGFYRPFTLVKDAQRHGAVFRPVDVTKSGWDCVVEGDGAVRLGLRYVAGLREDAGQRIAAARAATAFVSLQDFVDRTFLHRDEQRMLAETGALNAFGLTRRSALWQVEKAGKPRGPLFQDAEDDPSPSPLRDMTLAERLRTDLKGTGLTVGPHPLALYRTALTARGVRRAVELPRLSEGMRVRVAGAVICRQRPGTAKGFMFLTLEDETGLVNVTVRPDMFERQHAVLVTADVLEVDGVLQVEDGCSVRAVEARPAALEVTTVPSRDFR